MTRLIDGRGHNRWRGFALALLLLAGAGGHGGVGFAQEAPAAGSKLAQTPMDGPPTVAVSGDTAVPEFPSGVTFTLDASSPDEIESVELRYRPSYVDTLSVELPSVQPGDDVAVTQVVDLRDGSLPPGIDLEYYWNITEADGDVVQTAEKAVTWLDTRFAWTSTESPLVSVHSYTDDPAFSAAIMKSAEDTITRLSQQFGAEMTHPIRIWVYDSDADFSSALAPNSEPWVAGAAYPWYGLILAVLPDGDLNEVARVIPHEISHQVLYQATKNPFNSPPAWMDEGLATMNQGNGQQALWARVAEAADAGQLDHLESLNGQFPYDSQAAMLAYGESLSVVTYIIGAYGEEGLAKLIAVFKDGVSYTEAVQLGLGVSFEQLDADWRAAAGDQARQQLAAASTNPIGGGLGGPDEWLAAGGSLAMTGAAVLAIVSGARAWRRSRALTPDPEPGTEMVGNATRLDAWRPL